MDPKDLVLEVKEQRKPKDPGPVGEPEPASEPDHASHIVVPPEGGVSLSDGYEQDKGELETYTLKLTGSRSALHMLRAYIEQLGITYEVVK